MRVLFRVDAGPDIGFGHLRRCLALASALRPTKAECQFLVAGESMERDSVADAGFDAHPLGDIEPGSRADLLQTLEAVTCHASEVVVTDSYRVDTGYLSRLRETGTFVTAIDDWAHAPFPCHLVVNGGVGTEALPYRSSTGDTTFLIGPRYALLQDEFSQVGPREVGDRVQEVLVTMGGADGRNLTPRVLDTLDRIEADFDVTVIIGPFFTHGTEIEDAAERCQRAIRLVRSPDSMCDLMLGADLTISAGGQTLNELAATGTPAVAVQVAENQAGNICSFARLGTVVPIVFEDADRFSADLADAVNGLCAQPSRLAQMSRAGQRLIDGQGAARVVGHMTAMCSRS